MNESSQAADQSFLKIFKIGRSEFSYDESTKRNDDQAKIPTLNIP